MTLLQYRTNKCAASKGKKTATALVTSVLAILVFWMLAAGARAQSDGKATSAVSNVVATQAATDVIAGPAPAQGNSSSADGELKLVVALFRHGVRAPLEAFSDLAGAHSKDRWPDLVNDWHVDSETSWGDLTPHGFQAAKALGAYYGSYYSKNGWPQGFKAYLWADSADERTRETANALGEGLQRPGIDMTVEFLKPAGTADPLFHPFTAMCGTPDAKQLQQIVDGIKNNYKQWINSFKSPTGYNSFNDLYSVLGCDNSPEDCKPPPTDRGPLKGIAERVSVSSSLQKRPASPIKWEGQFSYASSATEAFLLEFANGMPNEKVGWGKVRSLPILLRLHEFYFDKTERGDYLAGVKGSNLAREILDQLDRAAKYNSPIHGKCPRANTESQFVGFVGHDTNLANVAHLLRVGWSFDDTQLPPDILHLPANDALPGGALVFELRQRGPSDYRVRIEYVTQSLTQIRDSSDPGEPFHVQTTCRDNANHLLNPCEMTLKGFNDVVESAIKNYDQFLSGCQDNQQVCPEPRGQKKSEKAN